MISFRGPSRGWSFSKCFRSGGIALGLRSLKTMAGRVMRDVERKISAEAFEAHKGTLILSQLILTQKH